MVTGPPVAGEIDKTGPWHLLLDGVRTRRVLLVFRQHRPRRFRSPPRGRKIYASDDNTGNLMTHNLADRDYNNNIVPQNNIVFSPRRCRFTRRVHNIAVGRFCGARKTRVATSDRLYAGRVNDGRLTFFVGKRRRRHIAKIRCSFRLFLFIIILPVYVPHRRSGYTHGYCAAANKMQIRRNMPLVYIESDFCEDKY